MNVCRLPPAPQGEQNPKLLERLVSFDPRSISVMALAKMMRLISEPEFNIVAVAQVLGVACLGYAQTILRIWKCCT